MTITGNAYTIKQIDKAVSRVAYALTQLPEGAVNAATIALLTELYLGAIDADKEENK